MTVVGGARPELELLGTASGPPPTERVRDYLKALRRRWLLVAMLTALALGAALAVSLTATKEYDATSQVVIERTDPVNALLDPGVNFSNDPERDINTGVALIRLEEVAERVRARVGLQIDPDRLLDKVETETEGTSDIVNITVRDPSPERAAALANAFAREYVAFRRESARERFDQAAALAESQLGAMTEEERESAEGRALEARLREIQIASALQTGGVRVVHLAQPPEDAAAPRPILNGVLAALLGLVAASAIAIGLEFADRRVKEDEEVEERFGLPVLGRIPRPRRGVGGRGRARHPEEEAYATLAANLRFLSVGGAELRTLIITSPGPAEGKTSVTLGLARALAMLRRRVIAIEADLRRPSFAEHVGLADWGGLTMVLAGMSDLSSQLIEIDPVSGDVVDGAFDEPDRLSYFVLPAGRPVPNPHRILSSAKMHEVVTQAREMADFLLIDTPPVATVSDAVSLASLVDAAVVVVRVSRTRRDHVRNALRIFQNIGVDVPGLVLTATSPADSDGYSYYAVETARPVPRRARSLTRRAAKKS